MTVSRGPATLFTRILLVAYAHGATPRTLVAKVERVSDGDTLTALTSEGTKLKIRLLGIDAPGVPHGGKPGQPFGKEARDYLDHVVGGKTIRVDAYGPDTYHRVLAVVWDEQININLLIVAMGYAEVYRGAPCQVYCQELEEAKARRDRVGMRVRGGSDVSPAASRIRAESSCLPGRTAGRSPAARSGTAPGSTPWASPGR
ncbi:MAG TPA: thermonuclease family protein [Candidatus Methylomirabilis sp.]|nr:thermonuclease family protein [Candidatus Methylomirabilis sp.]